jgi:hypothetical protein
VGARSCRATPSLWKAGAAVAGVAVTVLVPLLYSGARAEIARAVAELETADRLALALCATLTASALWATACGWRAATGARVTRTGAGARYGAGCLANTVAPGHLGGAVRTVLFASTIGPAGRSRALARCLAGTAAARWLTLSLVACAAGCAGELPRLVFVPALTIAAVTGSALTRVGSPALIVWMSLAAVARVGAAAVGCAALGVERPLGAGLAVVAASGLAGVAQVTPANAGVGGLAIALALHTRPDALAIGLALHAVETLVGLVFGVAGTAVLIVGDNASDARSTRDRARRLRHDRGPLRRVGRVVRVTGDAVG